MTHTKNRSVLSQLYLLSKPGIVYGNLFAGVAGYFLASSEISWGLVYLVGGLGLVLVSAGYANNIMDLSIDRAMKRTEKRPLVTGALPIWIAYLGSALSLIVGIAILYFAGNSLTALLGFLGWAGYLFVYGWAKRRSHHSTLIGAFPGALPPLIGYVFAAGRPDSLGWLLFAMMLVWQMPHFYAIALFRKDDYKAAGVPILSIVKGNARVLAEMRAYVVIYTLLALSMVLVAELHVISALILLVSALWWTGTVVSPVTDDQEIKWARKVFGFSLVILLLWPVVFGLNALL